jgi:hypothetical protein
MEAQQTVNVGDSVGPIAPTKIRIHFHLTMLIGSAENTKWRTLKKAFNINNF